ncbi:MAG: DUF5979 domain-containing protein [Solirubrobacteraceae bacterium]
MTKTIAGPAARQHGRISILVDCGSPLYTYAFLIPAHTGPGSVSQYYPGLPAGSRCTVTETTDGHAPTVAVAATERHHKVTIAARLSRSGSQDRATAADSPVECKPRFRGGPSPINKYDPADDCRCQIAELSEGGTRLKQWATFGGAAAALTGLLFVAVSIRVEFIAKSTELRSRAAQTLTLFAIPLVISILLSFRARGTACSGRSLSYSPR